MKGNEIYIWKEIYSQRFVAALVTIAKIWKQVSVHRMNDKETVFFRYPEFLESFVNFKYISFSNKLNILI